MKLTLKNNNLIFLSSSAVFMLLLAIAILKEQYYLLAIPFGILLFYTGWRSLAAAFLVLIGSIPFSTEFQFSDSLGTDLPDEFLMLLITALTLFHLIQNGKGIRRSLSHPLLFVVFTTLCWSLIATIFSSYPLMSVKYLLAKTWYAGAFIIAPLVVWNDKDKLRKTGSVLAVSMLIVTVIILFRHASEGFGFASVSDVVHPFFRNHVNYSSLLVCVIPVWFACWKLSSSIAARTFSVVAMIILLAAVFFSYARGAWLALIIGIVVYWLIRKRVVVRTLLAGFFLISVLLAWLVHDDKYLAFAPDHNTTIFHEDFREHLVATYEMTDMSAAERFYRWIAGVRMATDHPVVGFGPGTFYQNYKPYAVPAYETWVSDNPERSTVHNYFLLTASEQGVPALILLILLVTGVMYYSQGLFHRVKDPFYKMAAIITGVIFSMILTLNFLSDLVETDKIGSLFFLCIAALVAIDIQDRQADPDGR